MKECKLCAMKHIAQARVLLLESLKGYPLHRWYAVGHLAEAEDELEAVGLKTLIRDYRLKIMDGEAVDLEEIIDLLNQEIGD